MRLLLFSLAYSPFKRPLLLSIAKSRYKKIVNFEPRHKANKKTSQEFEKADEGGEATMISGVHPNWRQIGLAAILVVVIWIVYSSYSGGSISNTPMVEDKVSLKQPLKPMVLP